MWSVSSPPSVVRTVYPDCVSDVAESVERAKYASGASDVFAKSDAFIVALLNSDVHTLEPENFKLLPLTEDEMVKLYERHLVGAKLPATRAHYDRIRSLSEWCYACGHELAEEVDHYLPKRKFPALVVTPENLSPICIRCNRAKGLKFGKSRNEAFIHPYADNFDSVIWLHADVQTNPEPHLKFRANDPSWDATTLYRVAKHMREFKLGSLYAKQANKAARQSRRALDSHFKAAGADAVRAEAELRAVSSREDRLNSWEAAAWTAFSQSEWFCEGGYQLFGRQP